LADSGPNFETEPSQRKLTRVARLVLLGVRIATASLQMRAIIPWFGGVEAFRTGATRSFPPTSWWGLQSTTVARAHGLLGCAYLAIIRPFHVVIASGD
jgi:hypothetical protein